MVNHISFLYKARIILINQLNELIKENEINENRSELRVALKAGEIIYIKYNEFGEYGYQIIHSLQKNDFSRFDNFDDRWKVDSKPHHLHLRNKSEVIESPMNGNPIHDMPILIKYILNM